MKYLGLPLQAMDTGSGVIRGTLESITDCYDEILKFSSCKKNSANIAELFYNSSYLFNKG